MRATASISVAICTRDRPRLLRRALLSLAEQISPPAEILVIDNAPGDEATRELVSSGFGDVRYVREPTPGLDFARNRALAEAQNPIVAFLDDDAVAERGWTAALAAVFSQDDGVAVCTGRVEALTLAAPGQRLFEANGGFGRGGRRICLPADARRLRLHGLRAPLIAWSISVGSGCSLAVRRETIVGLGGFDEALDMGPSLPGGGDLDILWRVLAAGHRVVYEPRALAWHEHRRGEEEATGQILEHNRSLIAVLVKALGRSKGRTRAGIATFLLWRLAKPYVRLARRVLGRDPLRARVLWRLGLACWRGLGTYSRAQREAQRLTATATGEPHA